MAEHRPCITSTRNEGIRLVVELRTHGGGLMTGVTPRPTGRNAAARRWLVWQMLFSGEEL